MPKIKTHRGAAKRLKKTASGKFMFKKTFASHLLTGKQSKRMRRLTKSAVVEATKEVASLRRLLPYI